MFRFSNVAIAIGDKKARNGPNVMIWTKDEKFFRNSPENTKRTNAIMNVVENDLDLMNASNPGFIGFLGMF